MHKWSQTLQIYAGETIHNLDSPTIKNYRHEQQKTLLNRKMDELGWEQKAKQ